MAIPVERYLALFSGFWQPEKISNGCKDVIDWINHKENGASIGRWFAVYGDWRNTPSTWAMWMHKVCSPDAKIMLGGHSYGVHTAIKVAEELKKYDRVVRYLFSADGVEQTGVWGLLRPKRLIIPDNVREVHAYRQDKKKPKGSPLFQEGDNFLTRMYITHINDRKHAQMDELDLFQNRIKHEFFKEVA